MPGAKATPYRRKPGASRVASLAVRTYVHGQGEGRRRAGYTCGCLFLRWHAHRYRFRGIQRNTPKAAKAARQGKGGSYGVLPA